MVNLCPHQDTTTERIMFHNTLGGITFSITTIDSGTSICSEHEARFVGKELFSTVHVSIEYVDDTTEVVQRDDVL